MPISEKRWSRACCQPAGAARSARSSGGSLVAIDAGTNQVGATIGILPVSTATNLSGTFRDGGRSGFLEASNAVSTEDPATRDLYILNSQISNSLSRVTDTL